SIVSTPIGNLGDITLRAIETIKKCDIVVCEDTRVTGNLINKLEIDKKKLISYHGYSNQKKIDDIIDLLKKDNHVALVSDAGTPGISDPGSLLVSKAIEEGIEIEVIPGSSAFLTALSGSGLPINQFVYLGFLPIKKGRKTLLETFKAEPKTIVFYESVHRIERTLKEIADVLKDQSERKIVVGRELTKLHEEFVHSTIKNLCDVAESITKKGEFVVIIGK
ncbi:MAG: 16S rRNA (cytidine(1402)-2'-O)-methyltransferase, partial [Candidatus Peribacteraceae bacterium]|nr:16S rRNA (cytidine(1402)-2'-O)-methyltransferase [Candidatus Peribacteraceae bacterium]